MRIWIAVLAVGAVGWSASASAQLEPAALPGSATTPPAAQPSTPPASTPPAAPAPPAAPSADASPPAPAVGPVPTADETAAPSDHDAVVGHIGVEARRFDPGPM